MQVLLLPTTAGRKSKESGNLPFSVPGRDVREFKVSLECCGNEIDIEH